jgi:hypothetical protein
MQIFSFLFERHLEKTVLAAAVALSVFTLTRPEDSRIMAARSISSFLLYPVNRAGDYFTSVEELTAENDRLREMAVSLKHENERLTQFRDERNRLRELLGFRKDSFYEFMPCDVIARSSSQFHHSITVDRGSDSGVLPGMPVVGYNGLAGISLIVQGPSAQQQGGFGKLPCKAQQGRRCSRVGEGQLLQPRLRRQGRGCPAWRHAPDFRARQGLSQGIPCWNGVPGSGGKN